jgi:Tol biopolymer transport system component
MLVQHRSQPNWVLVRATFGLAATLITLVGCGLPATSGVATPDEANTPSPSLASETPVLTQTPSAVPSPTPEPPASTQAPVLPPAPTLVVPDWKTFLPAAPPEFGELANHLIFFSNRSGVYQLYQVALDGSDLVQLTDNPAHDVYDMEPAWSVDGKIAFTARVDGWWEVFVLGTDAPSPTQLTDFGADSWSLAWSPDGRSLVFVSNLTGDDEIYLVTLEDGMPVNLTKRPDANDFLPVWSPGDQQIAFVSDRAGVEGAIQELEQDIFVMAPDGSGVIRLTDAEGRDTSPNWSPDGRKIAFVSERDGNFEVYVMNADGGEPVRLTQSAGYEWSPTWSPDGGLIAFTSTRDHEETYDLYVMEPDGSNQTRLTSDPANDIIPRWWP